MEQEKEEPKCPACGRAKSAWHVSQSEGYRYGNETFCCEGCAFEGPCTCDHMATGLRLEQSPQATAPPAEDSLDAEQINQKIESDTQQSGEL
jgi:hypothetical protein